MEIQIAKIYRITYKALKRQRMIKMAGFSEEDVRRRFVSSYPDKSIIGIKEISK